MKDVYTWSGSCVEQLPADSSLNDVDYSIVAGCEQLTVNANN